MMRTGRLRRACAPAALALGLALASSATPAAAAPAAVDTTMTPTVTAPAAAAVSKPAAARAKAAANPTSWQVRGTASCSFIYNDNILGASTDDIDAFESGSYPFKFAHQSTDDLVVAPGLDVEARRDIVALGQTRVRVRAKHWIYANNPIKTNTDLDFFLRQYIGKGQSLELYLHASPFQYIRHLSDRSPLVDPTAPLQWNSFRFQRNIWNLTWRQAVTPDLAATLVFERNFRYYNREFMENDIEAWEIRGSLAWTVSRVVSLSGDYSYEDGNGRGVDEVGESLADTDNSDPSYERDLYRLGVDLALPKLARYVDEIGLTFLFMDYYYTAQGSLVDDPYHVGRRDLNYKYTVELQRKLSRDITLRVATRRSSRTVESPWEGDLTTDKAFVQWQTWVDLAYRF
ncbi:MAG: hypothetical protein IPK64_13775 [bacterium]|nr:hypothetical protein [bacterium]